MRIRFSFTTVFIFLFFVCVLWFNKRNVDRSNDSQNIRFYKGESPIGEKKNKNLRVLVPKYFSDKNSTRQYPVVELFNDNERLI